MDHNQLGGGGGGGGHQRPPSVATVQERRRVMEGASQQLQQPQQAPPQLKCPRCQSNNTKFCYYNNYSQSQPRYFCKGCRRYWTHGGTLRNVPVGGCSRKSKRPKVAEPSASAHQQQQQQQHHLQAAVDHEKNKQNVVAHLAPISIAANLGLVSNIGSSSSAMTMAPQMLGAHYQGYGGQGFLSSLAAIQAMNHPRPPRFTQALGVSGGGGDMDSPLLRGFALPSFGIQQSTTRPSGAGNHQQTWQQGLMGNMNQLSGDPAAGSDARFWSIGRSSGNGSGANNVNNNNNGNSHVGSDAIQHPNLQWPDHFGGGGCGGLHDA